MKEQILQWHPAFFAGLQIELAEERFEVGNMCEALEEILEKNLKEKEQMWISQGIPQGERQKLLELVKKKLDKGKSVSQIAEELEETEDVILPLYMQLKAE